MTPQDEKQAIYLAMTVTAETVTKGLTEIIDNVKIALEALLKLLIIKQNYGIKNGNTRWLNDSSLHPITASR